LSLISPGAAILVSGRAWTVKSLNQPSLSYAEVTDLMAEIDLQRMLSGGDPRTLGRAEEVVSLVLTRSRLLPRLFECVSDDDEVVRMRAADALEKVCRQQPSLLEPYISRLLDEVALID
jgi:hypothetical protein